MTISYWPARADAATVAAWSGDRYPGSRSWQVADLRPPIAGPVEPMSGAGRRKSGTGETRPRGATMTEPSSADRFRHLFTRHDLTRPAASGRRNTKSFRRCVTAANRMRFS